MLCVECRLRSQDGGSTVIDVGNGITAEIPQTIFDALGLDNTTEQVVVVVSGLQCVDMSKGNRTLDNFQNPCCGKTIYYLYALWFLGGSDSMHLPGVMPFW
eukprot:6006026-Amphidinium_carterae.1